MNAPSGATKHRSAISVDLFNRITRYTRMVLFGKWALGAVSIVIILVIIAIPLIEQTRDGKRISFVSSQVVSGEKPEMIKPKLEGVTEKNEPYTATAVRAIQESENVVLLYQVQADLTKADNSWLNLTANEGRYDSSANQLELWGDVALYKDDGYNFDSDRVVIDTRAGSAKGNGPITGEGPLGNMSATGYVITESGARMLFGNGRDRVNVKIRK